VVLYLNEDWKTEQGGALRLYPPQSPTQSPQQSPTQSPQENTSQDIYPEAGRIAIFLSADMPHEVLPATRDRMSLTGWFKRRGTVQL
jgi:SM-20-related protein